ncbi:lasso RiPP family leader peptide-containing protein [Streptomyces sp.]
MKYSAPQLRSLGSISELTLGASGSRADGNSRNPKRED